MNEIEQEIKRFQEKIKTHKRILEDYELDLYSYSILLNENRLSDCQTAAAERKVGTAKFMIPYCQKEIQQLESRIPILEKLQAAEAEEVAA